ncbi:Ig-like domain-containing protein, partial [Xanthomonas sacchari]|uniref:Ig-like domain-containing protein n=1 Tax=Xanthomonas sacchari TaxID=56458 RepID=UPI0022566F9D
PPLHVPAGQAPVLPELVSVQYNDGSRERVPVQWPPLAPASYAKPGRTSVVGQAQGRDGTGTLPVRLELVIEAETTP